MPYDQAYHDALQRKREIARARKNARTKAELKSLDAQDRPQKAYSPPPPARYQLIADECLRGFRDVETGDGKIISFKDAQYFTNDPAEAKFLASQPGISLQDTQREGAHRTRSMFFMPEMPWKRGAA